MDNKLIPFPAGKTVFEMKPDIETIIHMALITNAAITGKRELKGAIFNNYCKVISRCLNQSLKISICSGTSLDDVMRYFMLYDTGTITWDILNRDMQPKTGEAAMQKSVFRLSDGVDVTELEHFYLTGMPPALKSVFKSEEAKNVFIGNEVEINKKVQKMDYDYSSGDNKSWDCTKIL